MIDLRHHLASIIGVFLALALGMLIGTQLAEDGAIAQEQARLVERIEADLERIRVENRRLRTDLAGLETRLSAEEQFVDRTLRALVDGALSNRQVSVYVPTADVPVLSRVRSVLEGAGAQVTVHERATPPGADGLDAPYVLLWLEEWGPVASLDVISGFPAGGVLAWPKSWTKAEAAMFAAGLVSAVEQVGSPYGMLALVEHLRSDTSTVDVDRVLVEKFGR